MYTHEMTNAQMYRDYFNNFTTVSGFAEYYGCSVDTANKIIEQGRIDHNREATAGTPIVYLNGDRPLNK